MSTTLRIPFTEGSNRVCVLVCVMNETDGRSFLTQATQSGGTLKPMAASWKMFNALIDTGATSTCITEKVCKRANITKLGPGRAKSAFGTHSLPTCNFHIGLVEEDTKAQHMNMNFRSVNGLVWPDTDEFDVIIGMDVITSGLLFLDGKGICILSVN